MGKAEAARLIGIHKSRVSKLVNDPPMRVQKETASAILTVLRLLQKEDIVLSKASIHHGAVERGKVAKRPRYHGEWNGIRDIKNAEYKRNQRRRQSALHMEAG